MHHLWKKLFFIAAVLLVFILPSSILAANKAIKPSLILNSIKQVSSQESSDEIYFIISDLYAKNNSFYTIPGSKPYFLKNRLPQPSRQEAFHYHLHWQDKYLSSLKNITFWTRKIENKQGTQLIVTLVEADAPPWDLDDTLGSVKINLMNVNGVLQSQFKAEKNAKLISQKSTSRSKRFTIRMQRGKASYQFVLTLKS